MNATSGDETCPACRTAIPKGRNQCVACGKVVGEDNRCPNCNAIAGVQAGGARFLCAACGKPRPRNPGTVVLGGKGDGAVVGVTARRGGAWGLRILGWISLAGGLVFGGLAAILLPDVFGNLTGYLTAAAFGLSGVGVGAVSLLAAAGVSGSADRDASAARRQAVIELAKSKGFILTAEDVADALDVSTKRADSILTRMSDGSRITVEVTNDGVIQYWFRELMAQDPRGVRARVELAAPTEAAELEAPASSQEQQQRGR